MGEKKVDDKKNMKVKAGSTKPSTGTAVAEPEVETKKGGKLSVVPKTGLKSDTFTANHGCKNAGQDILYGNQQRVFNTMKDGSSRCTVCGTKR